IVGPNPYNANVTPDGSKVYVTNEFGRSVSVISTATNIVLNTITVGNNPSALGNFFSSSVTGIASQSIETENISIFPNPFTSQTTIAFSQEQKNSTISITDVLGKEIRKQTFSGREFIIEKGEMSSGIYFVRIVDENKNAMTRKI